MRALVSSTLLSKLRTDMRRTHTSFSILANILANSCGQAVKLVPYPVIDIHAIIKDNTAGSIYQHN